MGSPMRGSWIVTAVLLAASLVAGAAQALPADKHIELEADDGESCAAESKVDCFRVVNDTSLDGIEQGDVVHVVVRNVGSNPHNVYVTEAANADDNNVDTSGEDAINSSDTIDPDQETDLTFQVPGEAEGLYFWCDVGSHETLGMWLETSVSEASGEDTGEDTGSGDDNTTGEDTGSDDEEDDDVGRFLPAPGPVAALAASLVATLWVRIRP